MKRFWFWLTYRLRRLRGIRYSDAAETATLHYRWDGTWVLRDSSGITIGTTASREDFPWLAK
jgi:hypothetical protein